MNTAKNYHVAGLLLTTVAILSSRLSLLPAFVEGFCIGLGLTLQLIAAYAYRHDISGLKAFKQKLLKSILG